MAKDQMTFQLYTVDDDGCLKNGNVKRKWKKRELRLAYLIALYTFDTSWHVFTVKGLKTFPS